MLADRHYMRDTYNPARYTPILIGVLIGAFVIQSIFFFYTGFNSYRFFGLTVSGLHQGRIWQLLTFQFLHSCPWPWHVLLNCLALYFFGRSVEETLGSRRFLTLYLLSGVVGGLLQVISVLFLPGHPDIPVVGASAGVCGILAIFCSLYPMREVTTWIYFFPVNIRAKYLLWFVGGLSLFGTVVPFDNVAHSAHLGGVLLGMSYVRWFHESDRWVGLWSRLRNSRGSQMPAKVRAPGRSFLRRGENVSSEVTAGPDFISKEVDPILDKISAHGIQSLTERERRILEAARAKMSKR